MRLLSGWVTLISLLVDNGEDSGDHAGRTISQISIFLYFWEEELWINSSVSFLTMKEVTIKYKDSKVLQLLKSLAKYLDFSIAFPKKGKIEKNEYEYINGIPVIPGNNTIDIGELSKIFTGKNIEARKLRTEGWQRQK